MDMGMAAADQDEILCDRYVLLHRGHYARAAGFAPFSQPCGMPLSRCYPELRHPLCRAIERFRQLRRLSAVDRCRLEANLPTGTTRPIRRSPPPFFTSVGTAKPAVGTERSRRHEAM